MPTAEPDPGDQGLLSPYWAGSAVARATSDAAIVAALLDVELALVDAYAELGLAPAEIARTVRAAAGSRSFDPAELAVRARGGGNPVIPLVGELRKTVASVDPEAARWVHLGATSQDILDTALMLVARRALELIRRDAQAAVTALGALADRHRNTLTVSRTLTQHGVPTTFGAKAALWLHGLLSAARALDQVALRVQWGGAGGTLASFSVIGGAHTGLELAEALAGSLGLPTSPVPWQTERAPVTALGDALATLSDALATIAGNVLLLARPEIAELAEPAAAGRGVSSSMPQKHNPVLSVLIAAATRQSPALAAELHRSAQTTDERPPGAWHAEWQALRELLRLAGGAMSLTAELTSGLIVHPEAMRANLEGDGTLLVSERLMLEFGPRIGRGRLQELVSAAAGGGPDLRSALRAEPGMADIGDEALATALDPARYLGAVGEIIDRVLREAAEGIAK